MKFESKYLWLLSLALAVLALPLACGSNSPTSSGGSGSSATNTFTPITSPVPTSTPTNTFTATFTPTSTASNTPTKTNTNTATNTATATPTKTWTPCLTPEVVGDTNTTASGSQPSETTELYYGNYTSPAFAGNLRDIRVYMATSITNMQVGIFTTVSGKPGTAVAISPTTSVDTGGAYQTVFFYFPSTPALSASTAYTLCVLWQSGSNVPTIGTHSGGTNFNAALITGGSDLNGTIGNYSGPNSNEAEIAVDYCH